MVFAFDLQILKNFTYNSLCFIDVTKDELLDSLIFFKENKFNVLLDILGVDYPENEERVQVNYIILSLFLNKRICIRVNIKSNGVLPTSVKIFKAANWFEREVYDMYGVIFKDNRDLRRILTDYDFEGYPLLKDFPLTGYKEVRYDIKTKEVVYDKVNLQQEYRDFDFLSPWEGMKIPNSDK